MPTPEYLRRLGSAGAGTVLAALVLSVPAAANPADDRVVFRFTDPAIVESSGLVVTGGLVVTTNDSGDSGRVFVVDPATGDTVGVTTWAPDPVDVEALAPAAAGAVWVGDIGDNDAERDRVEVARVPVGRTVRGAAPTVYRLVHPDGPQDAEALLAHPRTGRLYVVSKTLLGGTVLAAPRDLVAGREQRLRRVADVVGLVTDGAFTADGRHVVLRTYGRAVVYEFPGFTEVGGFVLPAQPQGEGLAVGPGGDLWLSTEGAGTAVLSVRIPASIRRAMAEPSPSSGRVAGPASPGPAAPTEDPVGSEPGRDDALLVALGSLAVGAAGLGWLAWRRRRGGLG